jgi:hypothetical protein
MALGYKALWNISIKWLIYAAFSTITNPPFPLKKIFKHISLSQVF